jgi:hypothetical protein
MVRYTYPVLRSPCHENKPADAVMTADIFLINFRAAGLKLSSVRSIEEFPKFTN